jgi:hypothetical protein
MIRSVYMTQMMIQNCQKLEKKTRSFKIDNYDGRMRSSVTRVGLCWTQPSYRQNPSLAIRYDTLFNV